jgi:hypothetical protein
MLHPGNARAVRIRRLLRPVLAFLLAPLAPALPFLAISAVSDPGHFSPRQLVPFAVLVGMFAYPIALVLGLPVYVVFRWRRWNGALAYGIAGACIGGIGLPGLLAALSGKLGAGDRLIPMGMLLGLLCAGAFWCIARPDQIGDR